MSSKPPTPGHNSSATQFQALHYPLYMNSDGLHLPNPHAAAAAETAADHHSFYSRNVHSKSFEGDTAAELQAGHNEEQGRTGLAFTDRFKRWSFDQEKGSRHSSNMQQSYNMSSLLEIAAAQNDQNLLSAAAGGGAGGSAIREGGGQGNLLGSLRSGVGESIDVGFMPLSGSNTPYLEAQFGNTKPQYSTQDMEILSVNQAHTISSTSVQPHLYEEFPSSLTHQNLGVSASYLSYNAPHRAAPPTSYHNVAHHDQTLRQQQHLQLLNDHQWAPGLSGSSAGAHPHAELLLLPGISESVVEASPTSTHTAALSNSKLDLLQASSLHDKQAQMLPSLGGLGTAAAGGRMPSAQMWHIADKLDMAVGLGLPDHPARSTMFVQDMDHYASARHGQSGLSLYLQSPQHKAAQTALSLDAARYSARSASAAGSVGVLRNSRYLKAAQQLLSEFCNVCRDALPDVKSSIAAASLSQHIWNVAGVGADDSIAGNRAFLSAAGQKDITLLSADHYKGSTTDRSSSHQFRSSDHEQDHPHGDAAGSPSPASLEHPTPPHKQLPADERCHLQMRKARLIAMVEELDRRYQQYRDQMQLIVTSFESATGMGAAAVYTTLWRKGMSRQFRTLRDAIGEHISKVCRMLGEEVSSIPILSRGETPRLRIVDQRLRHQRSLQQIGMLPQQQAWRPQRGLPERSVSVLRAWLFEHFLHPYPKDSEKSMLARLTGLSRNQVSNWFINARVRLWKPMIEEMYTEESKALELSEQEASNAVEVMRGMTRTAAEGSTSSDHSSRQSWQQAAAPAPAPAAIYSNPAESNLYDTRQHRDNFSSFMHFHGSARSAIDQHAAADMQVHAEAAASSVQEAAQYSWMKGMQAHVQVQAEHAGDIGVLTHSAQHHQQGGGTSDHMSMQAAALMQSQLNASSSFMKNGVSLTLGLQQPPPHSSYNTSNSAYNARPSEALLF
eukprot:c24627_g1_i1 orf=21-2876(-)